MNDCINGCHVCGQQTILKVAENYGLTFYACCNEECRNYAEPLVETNGGLISVADMIETYQQIVKEITNEKNNIQ